MNITVIHKIVCVKCCKMAALTKTRNTRHTRTRERNKTNKKSNWQGLGGRSLSFSFYLLPGLTGAGGYSGFFQCSGFLVRT